MIEIIGCLVFLILLILPILVYNATGEIIIKFMLRSNVDIVVNSPHTVLFDAQLSCVFYFITFLEQYSERHRGRSLQTYINSISSLNIARISNDS